MHKSNVFVADLLDNFNLYLHVQLFSLRNFNVRMNVFLY